MNVKLRSYLLLMCFFRKYDMQQGVLDTTFNTADDGLQGDGFDDIVRTVALQSDGILL
jgi:hypothetical protein